MSSPPCHHHDVNTTMSLALFTATATLSSQPRHCHSVITSQLLVIPILALPWCHHHPHVNTTVSLPPLTNLYSLRSIYDHKGAIIVCLFTTVKIMTIIHCCTDWGDSSGSPSVFCTTTEVATLQQISVQTRNTELFLRRAMLGLCSPPPGLPAPLPVDGYRNLLDATRSVALRVPAAQTWLLSSAFDGDWFVPHREVIEVHNYPIYDSVCHSTV